MDKLKMIISATLFLSITLGVVILPTIIRDYNQDLAIDITSFFSVFSLIIVFLAKPILNLFHKRGK